VRLKRLRFACENQIFPFFPRKWENCPYFSMKRFVMSANGITNSYK